MRDKKFTYILVVDYGVVRSTRMCRIDKKCIVQRGGIVDNRKLLEVMASNVQSNLLTRKNDKKTPPEVQSDKKKRKREDKKEENIASSSVPVSVPKRKKLSNKEDNRVCVGPRSSSSSLSMDKTVGGDKIKWEPQLPVDVFQGANSNLKQGGRGGSTARITFFLSLY